MQGADSEKVPISLCSFSIVETHGARIGGLGKGGEVGLLK